MDCEKVPVQASSRAGAPRCSITADKSIYWQKQATGWPVKSILHVTRHLLSQLLGFFPENCP
jgi:hypothetical protein